MSVTVSATASVPNSPTSLTATADGQTEIDLSWTAPSDDGGSAITGYRIDVSEDGSNWSDLNADTGSTDTSYSHTGLDAGSTRHYRVSAINSAGTGPASNSANATTDAPEQAEADTCATGGAVSDAANNPGLVSDCETLLAAKDTLRGTATLNWAVDAPIASWDAITVSGTPRRVTKIETAGENLDLSGTIPSELGNLPKLQWLSLNNNQLTGSIPSELGNLPNLQWLFLRDNRLTGMIPAKLGSLRSLIYLDIRDNQLTGTIPAELGNLTKLFDLKLHDNRLTGEIPVELGNLTNLTELFLYNNLLTGTIPAELTNLTNLSQLLLRNNQLTGCIPAGLRDVRQHDLDRLGLPDCVENTAPGAPTALMATADGQTQIDLSWAAPSDDGGADITGYKIEVSTDNSTWSDLVANTGSTTTTYAHTGLDAGSTRHYRVSAINSVGTGDPSNVANATTEAASAAKPSVPTGLKATADGQTEIDLSWSAPSDDGGANITGYRIEVSTDNSTWSDLVANTNSTGTSYSHTGLDAGSTRYYRVSAINSEGTGPISNVANATTDAPTKPGAPTGLTATANGQTQIDLSWAAPSNDGGADITGYRIEVSEDNSTWTDLVASTNSTSTSYSHTDLDAGSTRHYRVSAINSAGTGPVSNIDSATTDSPPAQEGTCRANLTVRPGERCTYPGTSEDFWVDSAGEGHFLVFTAGDTIQIRNMNINGVVYTFVARKQSDGNWLVEEVGEG